MKFYKPFKRDRRFKQVIPKNWMLDDNVLEEFGDGKDWYRQAHCRPRTVLDRMLADLERQEKSFDGRPLHPLVLL